MAKAQLLTKPVRPVLLQAGRRTDRPHAANLVILGQWQAEKRDKMIGNHWKDCGYIGSVQPAPSAPNNASEVSHQYWSPLSARTGLELTQHDQHGLWDCHRAVSVAMALRE